MGFDATEERLTEAAARREAIRRLKDRHVAVTEAAILEEMISFFPPGVVSDDPIADGK